VGFEIDQSLAMQLPEEFDPNSGFEGGFRLTEEAAAAAAKIYGAACFRRFDGGLARFAR